MLAARRCLTFLSFRAENKSWRLPVEAASPFLWGDLRVDTRVDGMANFIVVVKFSLQVGRFIGWGYVYFMFGLKHIL